MFDSLTLSALYSMLDEHLLYSHLKKENNMMFYMSMPYLPYFCVNSYHFATYFYLFPTNIYSSRKQIFVHFMLSSLWLACLHIAPIGFAKSFFCFSIRSSWVKLFWTTQYLKWVGFMNEKQGMQYNKGHSG